MTLIEAADEREEALAIAVALREALEGPGTAALVTPDRTLARRVREELCDGASTSRSRAASRSARPGRHAGPPRAGLRRCGPRAGRGRWPCCTIRTSRLGRPRAEVMRLARRLEDAVLRGVLPARALQRPGGAGRRRAGCARRRAHAPRRLRRASATRDFGELAPSSATSSRALAPAARRSARGPPCRLGSRRTRRCWRRCCDEADEAARRAGRVHACSRGLFEELDAAADPAILLDCAGYAALFDRLAAETPVRGPRRSHPRIKILGLLEARLLTADRIILGGLDETDLAARGRTDAFLNRPMRAALGLTPPERRIGLTAHDFEMALGQRRGAHHPRR